MQLLEACQNSKRFLHNLISCFQDAVLVTDPEGHILMTNSRVKPVLGYDPDEIENRELSLIFTPEDLTFLYPNLLGLGQKGEPFEGEVLLLKQSGERFFAHMVFRSAHDPALDRCFNFVSIRDIHTQKQLEKASMGCNYDHLVMIANGVAHELRNPLTGIGGFVNRLYERCQAVQDHGEYYSHIVNNLKRIERIVEKVDLLAGLPSPTFQMEDMGDLILDALVPYQSIMKKRRIALNAHVEPVRLKLDKEQIIRVFSILMDNALDAVSGRGTITIHVLTRNNTCQVEFADNGPGIRPEDLPFVFNPFFSTKADGAGMDLAIVKRIVESHGGTIQVRSENGSGTMFILHYPMERRRPIRISRL